VFVACFGGLLLAWRGQSLFLATQNDVSNVSQSYPRLRTHTNTHVQPKKAIWMELQEAVHAVDAMSTKTPDEAAAGK
jgi:hypothetical protein